MSGQHERKRVHSRARRIFLLIGLMGALYFLVQIIFAMMNSVETVHATRVTVDDAVSVTGCFVRDEKVLENATSDTIEHVISNGEKVSGGETIAVEYVDKAALEASQKVTELSAQMDLLSSVKSAIGNNSDTASLDQQITAQIEALEDKLHDGMATETGNMLSTLRELAMRRGVTTENVDALDQEITSLQDQIEKLQERTGGRTTAVTSPASGYFCETVDGYESVLTVDELKSLTPSVLAEKLKKPAKVEGKLIGKVMEGFSWYYAATMSKAKAAAYKSNKTPLHLRFAQVADDVPVSVFAIQEDEKSEEALVIFQSSTVTGELVSMREQSAEIIHGTYTGIRIPKSAIRMEGETMGVYVLSGTMSRFKSITPLYEGDDFYIIQINSSSADGVVLGDDIIVKATGVADQKVIK